MEVYCTKCGSNYYLNGEGKTPDNTSCDECGGKLIEPELTHSEMLDLCTITRERPGFYIDVDLYNAMVALKKNDIIEFKIKMAQFHEIAEKAQDELHKNNPLYYKNLPHCPHCNSTNLKKISTTSRMLSVGFWGLGSKKIGKQWHCNQCGSNF